MISEESDRLNALINNLLDASRIQAGGFKIERADVDLAGLAAAVVESWRTQTERHHFVLDFPAGFPDVFGDEERLRQVLNNLLNNAIKYSPEGGEVRVGGWREGDHVTVYVADQGIGIPRPSRPTFSSASTGSIRACGARRRAQGWGCSCAAPSSRRTAAASGCAASRARARRCSSRCP